MISVPILKLLFNWYGLWFFSVGSDVIEDPVSWAKDSRAHFPVRYKRSLWYPACPHRRWLSSSEQNPAALHHRPTETLNSHRFVCAPVCFLSSHACRSVHRLCVGQLSPLSFCNPASCLKRVWMLFLWCRIRRLALTSKPQKTFYWLKCFCVSYNQHTYTHMSFI